MIKVPFVVQIAYTTGCINNIYESGYLINFKHFHEMYESKNPPKCCAKDMDEAEENVADDESGDSNDANESNEFGQSSSEIDEHVFKAAA